MTVLGPRDVADADEAAGRAGEGVLGRFYRALSVGIVSVVGLSPTLAGFSLAAGGGTWAPASWVQSRPRVEPYRERLMTLGMLLVAAAIATLPSVLIDSVLAWTVAVAWGFGCFGMGPVISSTSVLLQLSAPEGPGANSAVLQISDGLSNVLLPAAGGAAFAALGGGGTVTQAAAEGAGAHPVAFAVVFLPVAGVALVGAWVSTRLRVT